ncbi:MAG: hypothetical protein AB1Z98_26015 [Nannocystaceae bacterium]
MPIHTSIATSLLSRALVATMLVATACDQADDALVDEVSDREDLEAEAEPTEAQTLAFSKELVVSDGANTVRLLVASDDEALLAGYDDSSFEIAPIFARPDRVVASLDDDDAVDPPQGFDEAVLIEEQSVQLEDGAIGYSLRHQTTSFRNGIQSCNTPNIYTSSADFAWVTVTSGSSCAESRISTRKYSWSWYSEKGHATLCSGMTLDAGKSNTNRTKLEVCPGPAFSHGFYN